MLDTLKAYASLIKAGLLALAVAAALAGVWHVSAERVRGQWAAADNVRLVAEKKATAQRLAANAATAATQDADREKLKKGYEDEIETLRAGAAVAGRVRVNAAVCSGFAAPAKTESPGRGVEAVAGAGPLPAPDAGNTAELPEPYSDDLDALTDEADKIVASCRVAQKFLIDNGFAP